MTNKNSALGMRCEAIHKINRNKVTPCKKRARGLGESCERGKGERFASRAPFPFSKLNQFYPFEKDSTESNLDFHALPRKSRQMSEANFFSKDYLVATERIFV